MRNLSKPTIAERIADALLGAGFVFGFVFLPFVFVVQFAVH